MQNIEDAAPTGNSAATLQGVLIKLDLTGGGVLEPELLHRLDQLATTAITPFNDMIAALSRGHERDIDWWVSRPACRNVFVSKLFYRCSQILLVQSLLAEGHRLEVLVDDTAFARTLRDMRHPRLAVALTRTLGGIFRPVLHTAWNIASSLFHTASAAMAARLTRRMARPLPSGPLTVVDVFILRDSMADGRFQDRYYPGLLDALTPEERAHLIYVPTFYRIRNYRTLLRELRRAETPFLVPQDSLTLPDYLFAFGHWLRLGKMHLPSARFAGVALGDIVKADLRAGRFAQSVITALLSYRFWTRHRHIAAVTRILDWYEGQDIDHALAAAINWSNAGIALTGFRPACSPFELAVMPAPHEAEAGVVPPLMAVTGEGFRRDVEARAPTLRTDTAPGLRHARLATLQRNNPALPPTLLLTLPLAATSVRGLRAFLAGEMSDNSEAPWRWLLKRHPAMPRKETERLFGALLQKRWSFIEGDFYEWLPNADIVIGLESSALLEAIAIGVPAICLAHGNNPTTRPFPDWADQRLWRVCYDAADLRRAITELLGVIIPDSEIAKLRHDLLSPADRVAIRKLLDCHPTH